MPKKTFSENLFEKYLISHGITYEYERTWKHTGKKPDYTIFDNTQEIIVDVTECDNEKFERLKQEEFGFIYKKLKTSTLRSKINHKAEQLKDFIDRSYAIVIYPPSHPMWFVEPDRVFESMFGDLAVIAPVLQVGHAPNSAKWTYCENGKMSADRNSHISAVITLRKIDEENVGVIVFENCYAKIRLSLDIFCGNYDIRYRLEQNLIKRVFVGKYILSEHEEIARFIS